MELRHVPLQEAPADALAALESFSPPSWQIVVSDCSDCSSVSEGEGIPGPSGPIRPRPASASVLSEPLSGRAPLEREQLAGSHPTVSSVSSSTGDLRVASKSLLGAAGAILAHKPSVTSKPPAPAEPFPPAPTTMPRDPNNDQSVVVGLKARLRELKDCLDEGLLTMDEFQEDRYRGCCCYIRTYVVFLSRRDVCLQFEQCSAFVSARVPHISITLDKTCFVSGRRGISAFSAPRHIE